MRSLWVGIFLLLSIPSNAQVFKSESSRISFFSKSTVEDIAANNTEGSSQFNIETGDITFVVPVTGFKFNKKLMQEHFNEKYLHTKKFPQSTFDGKILEYNAHATGIQNVKANGKFTLHGVTKDITIPGTLELSGNTLIMKSKFKVKLKDYDIPIPQVLWQNILEEIEITVEFSYKPLVK